MRSPLTIEPSSWWSRLASALKTTPVLWTSVFDRPFLLVEQRHELVGVFDERFELGEGRVDLFAAAVDPDRDRLLPDLEVALCVFGSNAERMSSSVTDGSTWLFGQLPAVGAGRARLLPSGISCT